MHKEDLTPREQEVERLMAQGLTNPEIAQELIISRETAKSHVERILAKRGFSSRREVIGPSSTEARDFITYLRGLTPRQSEILSYLGQGWTTRQIAQTLALGQDTIKDHIEHILEKTKTHSRNRLLAMLASKDLSLYFEAKSMIIGP